MKSRWKAFWGDTMENKNVVDIHVVIPDYEDEEPKVSTISGNPFAILMTCVSIFYNVGLDMGLSIDGMKKMFNEKIDKLVEHDKIE